jgi:hypothetical protein
MASQTRLYGALVIAMLLLTGPSPAHESWISKEGVHDCGIVMPAPIATPAGWAIHGDVIIDLNGRRLRVDEVVPYHEASPSPDGYFWRCHTLQGTFYDVDNHVTYVDGERRCFAPPQAL